MNTNHIMLIAPLVLFVMALAAAGVTQHIIMRKHRRQLAQAGTGDSAPKLVLFTPMFTSAMAVMVPGVLAILATAHLA